MAHGVWRRVRPAGAAALAALAVLAAAAAGCGGDEQDADLVAGKKLFVENCGSCHVLARAETKGVQGPDLDDAFRQAIADGMGRDGIQSAVREQIAFPANLPQSSPAYMPADLVTGEDAENVAAYVAFAAARRGEDRGALAEAVKQAGGGEPIAAENGVLEIPADPNGQLVYVSNRATASPGSLEIRSPNESNVPHNIAMEFDDRDDVIGEVVQDGGVSTIQVDVEAGEYAFYCSVAGHREAGMEGTLTVE